MKNNFHAVMIAGTHSSVGKTIWSLALMALVRKKNLTVQPFKAGPDYIDPGFHHELCAPRKSRNLDLFLLSPETVMESFEKNSDGIDLAIIEGMMGLFDGKGSSGQEASSAEIAKLLNLPVLLVVDGSGLATSIAAIVLGFQKFDPALNLAGVLINRVNHEGHFAWLKNAIESKTGIPCLGYLPADESLHIPERHLGLTTAAEICGSLQKVQKAADFLEKNFDWEKFLCVALVQKFSLLPQRGRREGAGSRIAVAYDAAFSFYYEDNFDLLRNAGAELIFFSPLEDSRLPADVDLLYLGGGFPEIYAVPLSKNKSMIQSVKDFYENGGFIYAECGGFIYLTEKFLESPDQEHELVGLIPGSIRMTDRLQHFGYHEIEAASDHFLFPKGEKIRSHEFHYSIWEYAGPFQPVYKIGDHFEGFAAERLVASYQHLHFGSDPELATRIVQACKRKKVGAARI